MDYVIVGQMLVCLLIVSLVICIAVIMSLNERLRIKAHECAGLEKELAEVTSPQEHWNSSGILPPVDIKLLIETDRGKLQVKRESWAMSRDSQLDFIVEETGETVTGRFKWRYL